MQPGGGNPSDRERMLEERLLELEAQLQLRDGAPAEKAEAAEKEVEAAEAARAAAAGAGAVCGSDEEVPEAKA